MRYVAPPGSELARLRAEAHHAFDVHWQFYERSRTRYLARSAAYEWLAGRLRIDVSKCHFGMFDERQCRRAIQICRDEAPPPRRGR